MTNPNLKRRLLAQRLASLTTLATLFSRTSAQTPPPPCCPGECCPTSIVVPFPPGGSADFVGRLLAKALEQELKTTVVVENKAGAGGMLGASTVAQGQKTGGQALLSTNGSLLTSLLIPKPAVSFAKDFQPVALVATAPLALAVPASSTSNNLNDLLQSLRANPGKKQFASPGPGTTSHLSATLLLQQSNTTANHIPYRGSAPALTDLMVGVIDFGFFDVAQVAEQVRQGRLRALAVGSSTRSNLLPNTPTLQEQGLKDFEAVEWFGIFTATGLSSVSSQRWQTAVANAANNASFRSQLAERGLVPQTLRSEAFGQFLNQQAEKWSAVAQRAGVKLD